LDFRLECDGIMRKKRTLIYVNADIQNHEFIYTGIEFYEFVSFLQNPIKNILLLKANYMGNNYQKNFELVEGTENVKLLTKEDVHSYGDFCFVDYSNCENVNRLTDDQIAEVLYMAHMYKPLKSPFFDTLDNRFSYLAHDDGWFCKLYCRKVGDFLDVLNGKIVSLTTSITKKDVNNLDTDIQKELLQLAEKGLLLDFEELKSDNDELSVNVYFVGKYEDMNKVLNSRKELKENALIQKCIKYQAEKWYLV